MMRVSRSLNPSYPREKLSIGVFTLIVTEFYGSTIDLLCLRIINFVNESSTKHICPNSLFILVAPKCITIFGNIFGGPE
jgi:hypothetical protein